MAAKEKTCSKIIYIINGNSSITVKGNSIAMAEKECKKHYPSVKIQKIETLGSTKNIHELKCWTNEFRLVCEGLKLSEFRRDDRGYLVNDLLLLKEYDVNKDTYSGREATLIISHKQTGFGIPSEYVVLSTKMISNNYYNKQ